MIRVLFRVDAGPGIGAGHMMRCLALAEALCACGGTVALLTVSTSPLPAGWSALGAEIHRSAATELGNANDLAFTCAFAEEFESDWVVADGYHFTASWLEALGRSRRLLYLDDLGQCDAATTLVLNQNAGAEDRYRNCYQQSKCSLLGLDWFLLGSAWRDIRHAPESRRLLLTLGASSSAALMLALMRALIVEGDQFVADVVVTAPAAEIEELMNFASDHADRFNVEQGPLPLAPLMARAAVVICGGGVTPVEALSLGAVPVILMLGENQIPGSQQLAAMGVAHAIAADDIGVAAAARIALDLLDDESTRVCMAESGRRMIDGKGAERVVQVMTGEVQ